MLDVGFGEETVTDLVLLELKRSHAQGIAVLQTNKKAESTQGTDWEWWLGSNASGWLRFAVQAKKLDRSSERYGALSHKVGADLQIDLLEKFAAANRAIPLYCLFNYLSPVDTKKSWHCCEAPAVPQFGCTLTPASVIRHAIDNRGCRTFGWIHSHPSTLPWRCVVKCGRFQKLFGRVVCHAGQYLLAKRGTFTSPAADTYPSLDPARSSTIRSTGGPCLSICQP
jgi:hypothetical protein